MPMSINADSALDTLARFVRVVGRDSKLRQWFVGLAQMSTVKRRNQIYAMTERMKARSEDADVVASFRLLADSRVFEAALSALREFDRAHEKDI